MSYAFRSMEPLPNGRFGVAHYKAVHRHLFGDVYRWAGRFRNVRIAKSGAMFCYPEHIVAQMDQLFERLKGDRLLQGLDRDAFARRAAAFLATLNHIHPFREGNGRSQTAFLGALSARAGWPLDYGRLDEDAFLDAMIRSFRGDERRLERQLRSLID